MYVFVEIVVPIPFEVGGVHNYYCVIVSRTGLSDLWKRILVGNQMNPLGFRMMSRTGRNVGSGTHVVWFSWIAVIWKECCLSISVMSTCLMHTYKSSTLSAMLMCSLTNKLHPPTFFNFCTAIFHVTVDFLFWWVKL